MSLYKRVTTYALLGVLVLPAFEASAAQARDVPGGYSRTNISETRPGLNQTGVTDRQYDRTDERRDDRQDNRQDDRQDDRWDDRRDDRWDDRQEWREERWEDLRRAYWRNQVIRHLWTLPVHKVVVVHNHRDYHYVDGEFFLFTDGRYVLVDPPAGVVIASLPTGYETLMVYGVAHYYFGGVYYAAHNHGFVVVHL